MGDESGDPAAGRSGGTRGAGPGPDAGAGPRTRLGAALAVALAFALGVYLLLDAGRPSPGLVSFTFLLVLPAAITAFICWVADPGGRRTLRQYLLVPVWLLLLVIAGSLLVLREGTICVVILAPIWFGSSVAGAVLTRWLRGRVRAGRTYCAAALALPVLAMQAEPLLPLPVAEVAVSRSQVVAAGPDRLWPLLRGIPDVRPGEGRWNVTQDVLGVPRPLGARLVGEGAGAARLANWGRHIRFTERITRWEPGRAIGWRFVWDDLAGWDMADRHLLPDSPYFRVTTGGYALEPLPDGRTRVTLTTRYRLRTPVNAYSAAWGELMLGDLENNLLALVKGRAEGRRLTR